MSGCWIWTGAVTPLNYGFIWINNKITLAHRVSYVIHKDSIEDQGVCHTCDNPICVNPDHLFLGTQADNNKDRDIKNRHARGKSLPQSKLDKIQVLAIRECRKLKIPQHEIARYFKVHQSLISYIDRGITWKHV